MGRRTASAGIAGLLAITATPAVASEELLSDACGSCHAATDAGLSRIAGQRKTPEGWLMTIVRMRLAHNMEISGEEQAALVAYLAETNGLAPSETDGLRYALERDPSVIETFEPPISDMCGRCHTSARVALQRRTAEEWDLHMDFHVGQFPTIEYQAMGRDREWYRIARDEIAPLLTEQYPFDSEAWAAWQSADKPVVSGDWIVATTLPGKGEAYGRLSVAGDDSPYEVTGELRLADGASLPVSGAMNLYTGYEWRANLEIAGETYRQVARLAEDGSSLDGRQFLRDSDSLGGALRAVPASGRLTVIAAVPSVVRGAETVQLVGVGVGAVASEGGLLADLAKNEFGATAVVRARGDAMIDLSLAGSSATIGHYETVDSIRVEPAFNIARVGGDSEVGPAPVPALFKAVGYWNGPDGEAGSEDDIRIGEVPANWSMSPHNEIAEAMQDPDFAGSMDAASGLFIPAAAGPNAARPFSTNNAGDLKITATSEDGLTADAQLIVTVQRWIDPPIR